MAHVLFDTLKFQEKLTDAGMLEKHAKAITIAQNDALCEAMDNGFATKSDIRNVQSDIGDVKSELTREIGSVKTELHHLASHVKLHDWMLGTCLAGIGTILIKLFFG